MCSPSAWSAEDADDALRRLLQAALEEESMVAARDAAIAAVQVRYGVDLAAIAARIVAGEKLLAQYYDSHRPDGAKKVLQFGYGAIGLRSPSNPALVPADGWTWESVAKRLKALFKSRFFHAPKPPAVDKVKIKRELSEAQLAKCGLKLDDSETFYIDLNRLKPAEKRAA